MSAPAPLFICDSMLGRLAKNLRMLGIDTLYAGRGSANAHCAAPEHRILLTRRTAFLKKKPEQIASYIFIKSNDPAEQVQEVIAACALKKSAMRPFTICLNCNAQLTPVAKEAALGRVPEYVFATVAEFTACPQCGKIYWKGTHYDTMRRRIAFL
jgi:uncharacterized protein with PIN domain